MDNCRILIFTVVAFAWINCTFHTHIEKLDSEIARPSNCQNDRICESYQNLEKRIRSLEQPVWKISDHNTRWIQCSQGPCQCTPTSFSVSCYSRDFNRIPAGQTIPRDTITLDVGSNHLRSLHQSIFKNLGNLGNLDLSNNGFEYIPQNIFEDQQKLKYLLLQRNNLDSLSEAIFETLLELQTLDLSENRLTAFSSNQWNGLNVLTMLLLSNNKILEWGPSPDSLPNLTILDLSHNRISRLQKKFHHSLVSLQLHNNELTHVDPETFSNMRNLDILDLHRNNFESFPPHVFRGLQNLKFLDLSSNAFTEIPSNLNWMYLSSLTELRLNQNFVERLENNSFHGLSSLTRLNLDDNNIWALDTLTFSGLANLQILSLTNNLITTLKNGTFGIVENIVELCLDQNKIVTMEPDTLEGMVDLGKIKLGSNPWNCTCSLVYFANWLRDRTEIVTQPGPICVSPPHVGGRRLGSVSNSELCQ